jgi:hypothetical protein
VHGKFQLFRWNGSKYIEYMRYRLKKSGETKHFMVQNLKKAKYCKNQFYCQIKKDVCRVTLDFEGKLVDWNRRLHPKDVLFRGECDLIDYEVIENLYLVVQLPSSIFVVDQLTEQVLYVFSEFKEPQRTLVISPLFEIGIAPIVMVQEDMKIVPKDI